MNERPESADCVQCGSAVLVYNFGPVRKYCSAVCRGRADQARRRADGRLAADLEKQRLKRVPARYELACETCSTQFVRSRTARFCSERCREIGHPSRCANHPDKPVRAKGLCSTCYNDTFNPARRSPRPSSPDVRRRANRAKTQRRRAATHGADVEVVHTDVVGERDRWRCGICRRRVDRTKVYPHPRSPSLDHIVPLSERGEHTYANTRITHLGCNLKRGNRGGDEQLALLGQVG